MTASVCLQAGRQVPNSDGRRCGCWQPASRYITVPVRVVFARLPACLQRPLHLLAQCLDSMHFLPVTLILIDSEKRICVLSQHSDGTRDCAVAARCVCVWGARGLRALCERATEGGSFEYPRRYHFTKKCCHKVAAWHTPLTVIDKTRLQPWK